MKSLPSNPIGHVAVPIFREQDAFGALLVFARNGDWAITRFAHAGREDWTYRAWCPNLGRSEITWLGDGENFGKAMTCEQFSDAKLLKALRRLTPFTAESLRERFHNSGEKNPGRCLGRLRGAKPIPGGAK